MMKNLILLILCLLILPVYAGVNNPDKLKGSEQYGVFYINEIPPQYAEDFYQLYNKRLYYNEDNVRVNIYYLSRAIRAPFRHASKALCLLKTEDEAKKYRSLLIMHFYIKIMQNYLTLGTMYDKKNIYFFNRPFKKDLLKSLKYARFYYGKAKEYWKYVLRFADKANKINSRIDIDSLEDELFCIINRQEFVDWDYDYTFNLHLSILEDNLKKLQKD